MGERLGEGPDLAEQIIVRVFLWTVKASLHRVLR